VTIGQRRSAIIVLALVLCVFHSNLVAEERSMKLGSWDIGFSVIGGFINQGSDPDSATTVRMPAYMENERRNSPMASYYPVLKTDNLTDNPLLHGALYAHFILDARSAGFRLYTKVITEHRGTSYGTYATDNIAVMPTLFVSVDTSFAIGGESFGIDIEGGNYEDHKLHEGLTIYNIDVQSYHMHLNWRNLKLSLDHIGDLVAGIGLNIDDQQDYTLSLEGVPLGGGLRLDASAGYFEYLGGSVGVDGLGMSGMNLSAGLGWNDRIRVYTQLGMRGVEDPAFEGIERCADLVGVTYRDKMAGKLDFDLTGEYRYYGRYFNAGHSYEGSCFYYRGYEGYGNCSLWNTVGSQLYPLHEFFRPFSQWAVYTDYEDLNVQSFIFRADASYRLPVGFSIICNLDFNYMDVSNEEAFLYPFYNLGFGWSPVRGTTIALSHTNRAMNLDKHYPTLYLTEPGTLMITVQSAIYF
jgi:hypothetical protein